MMVFYVAYDVDFSVDAVAPPDDVIFKETDRVLTVTASDELSLTTVTLDYE